MWQIPRVPSGYELQAKIIGYLLLVLVIFMAGWTVKGWKEEVAYKELQNEQLAQEKKRAEDALKAQQEAIAERDKKQGEINSLEAKYHEDVAKAKKEIDCLRNGKCRVRVYVPTMCPAGAAGGGDTAVGATETGAELTGAARQSYLDLRQAIMEEQAKTETLQNIARACSKYQR